MNTTYKVTATPVVMDAEGNPQGQIAPRINLGEHAAGTKLILNLGPHYCPIEVTVCKDTYGPALETGRNRGVQMDHVSWEYREIGIELPDSAMLAVA